MMGKMEARIPVGYILAQLAGALLGCLPLLAAWFYLILSQPSQEYCYASCTT
jgi:glycerol uptake facilitator-like aquaporin